MWLLKKLLTNNINNPLYLMINEMIGHFEEKKWKYLVLDDVDENKEVSKKI